MQRKVEESGAQNEPEVAQTPWGVLSDSENGEDDEKGKQAKVRAGQEPTSTPKRDIASALSFTPGANESSGSAAAHGREADAMSLVSAAKKGAKASKGNDVASYMKQCNLSALLAGDPIKDRVYQLRRTIDALAKEATRHLRSTQSSAPLATMILPLRPRSTNGRLMAHGCCHGCVCACLCARRSV